jgi:hypothetical protein
VSVQDAVGSNSPTSEERSWEESFLRILNNREKGGIEPQKSRSRGFVVLVRNALSLEAVQSLCLRQEWNDCLTARYRFETGPVFGTLFAAFHHDTYRLIPTVEEKRPEQKGTPAPAAALNGVLRGDAARSRWPEMIRGSFLESTGFVPEQTTGEFEPGFFLSALGSELAGEQHTGQRLVLICEIAKWPEGTTEWDQALHDVFPNLPERVGVVISGVPPELKLPRRQIPLSRA